MFRKIGARIPLKMRPWIKFACKIVFLFLLLFVLLGIMFGMRRISGIGMNPNLNDGELVLFSRVWNDYAAGDAVLFTHDGVEEVSRIFATGGQIVDVNSEGYFTVNGAVQSEGVVIDLTDPNQKSTMGLPFRVPDGAYFLLNDNYEYDADSRTLGPIYEKDLKGRIISTLKVRNI